VGAVFAVRPDDTSGRVNRYHVTEEALGYTVRDRQTGRREALCRTRAIARALCRLLNTGKAT
jgi:hypothetical protein